MKKKYSITSYLKNSLRFIGLNSVQAGVQFCYSTITSVAIPYFGIINNKEEENGVYGIAQITIGICGSIVGMIITLCVCGWSDRCTFKYGRRRIFIGIGVLFECISIIFLITSEFTCKYCHIGYSPTSTNGIDWLSNILAFIGLSFMYLGANFMSEPSHALIPDFFNYKNQQIAYFYSAALGAISGFICNVIGGVILLTRCGYYYSIIFSISFIVLLISFIPTLIVADEEKFIPPDEDFSFKRFILAPFINTYHGIKEITIELIIIYILLMLSWIAYYPASFNMTIYYAKDIFHINNQTNPKFSTAISIGMFSTASFWFIQVISPFVLPLFEKCYGKVRLYFISNIFAVFSYAILSIAPSIISKNVAFNPSVTDILIISSCFIAHQITAFQFVEMNSLPFSYMKKLVSSHSYATHLGLINVFITFGQIISLLLAAGLLQIDVWTIMAFSSVCFLFVSLLSTLLFFVDKKVDSLLHQVMKFENETTTPNFIFE
ncbi:sucrose transporter, putative [Entamoeba nuttalli P19]|uniref:Sucrose transporter, putative n=1 Tax=Entamoeba nuttalli (strain P19) TaxID=1076696 RepID=K2H4D0_ENTNP|nr:sucrose transporter, putative [Entamoeba nuttalli P19]EKE37334.1 sucrose transporter, putative [Entamoeba nuttalli P19]|eukprot:XP_008860330.1 sucrose transporter, putative [Entamoeba nuttalli P19]